MPSLDAQPLWDWIDERHRIYLAKQAGKPRPWTRDPILQQYRFCNVSRELDTVTIWIREHIREPFAEHSNLWFMLAIARQINHPPTLQELMDQNAWPIHDWDPTRQLHAANIMNDRKQRGDQVYTGAYMIRAESDPRVEWYTWSKQEYMTRIVLGRVWEKRGEFHDLFCRSSPDYSMPPLCRWCEGASVAGQMQCARCGGFPQRQPTLQEVHKWFMQFHGWGGFMAYEVVTDLRHTRYLRNAPDEMTWANAGPGAIRGLNRLFGRPLDYPLKQQQACAEMQHLLSIAPLAVGRHVPPLEMRDIEHSLCETDKYLRVLRGEGRPRALYRPKEA